MSLHDNMRTIVWTCPHEGSPKVVPSWKILKKKSMYKALQINQEFYYGGHLPTSQGSMTDKEEKQSIQ